MEKRINKIYKSANEELRAEWDKFMASHEAKLKEAHAVLQSALKTGDSKAIADAKEHYEHTAMNITINNDRYKAMVEETAEKIAHVNEVALDYVNDNMAKVYTMNYNALGDQDLKGYSFSLTNEEAVKNLAKSNKALLPTKKLNIPKDERWNHKQINSQMMQGILQGESIPKLAQRLGNVTTMNVKSAIRNARTMTTAAENKGRLDSFKKASDDGIIMTKEWIATGDDRTRDWHLELDGTEVATDEPWENEYGEIMYPGDPNADPANVYNCRCAMRAHVIGFKMWDEDKE